MLPLALLGAPVSIGETRVTVYRLLPRLRTPGSQKTENLGAALPGQDRMWSFGIIGVATRYTPPGAHRARGGRGIVEDMCYERRRAEASVD